MIPTLDEFRTEVEGFLAAWPLKEKQEGSFTWGSGSDDVSIFEEFDPEEEKRQLEVVRAWRAQLAEAGLAWISGPTDYGGRGLPKAYAALFDAVARRHTVPGNGPLMVSLGMVAPTLLAHGTDLVKQSFLRQLFRGDLVACQLFSEPGAGSDLASVQTRAVRDGDGWRVSGQKVWTSGAHYADIGEVLCLTSQSAHDTTI